MDFQAEVSGLVVMTVPPNRWTAVAPVAASFPSPDSVTAMTRLPAASASVVSSRSAEGR
jgi:hypothetical protein